MDTNAGDQYPSATIAYEGDKWLQIWPISSRRVEGRIGTFGADLRLRPDATPNCGSVGGLVRITMGEG
jgi:hypothetical protein